MTLSDKKYLVWPLAAIGALKVFVELVNGIEKLLRALKRVRDAWRELYSVESPRLSAPVALVKYRSQSPWVAFASMAVVVALLMFVLAYNSRRLA